MAVTLAATRVGKGRTISFVLRTRGLCFLQLACRPYLSFNFFLRNVHSRLFYSEPLDLFRRTLFQDDVLILYLCIQDRYIHDCTMQ